MKAEHPKKHHPLLDVVIVNWNSGAQLYECLTELQKTRRTYFVLNSVCVVDNASIDGSLSGIETLDLPLKIIRNRENRGFGAAVNQAAKGFSGDYLLLLNPDTKVFEDSLDVPLTFLNEPKNASVGIAGIQNVDESGTVMRTCARFPEPKRMVIKSLGLDRLFPRKFFGHFMKEWDHRNTRMVDQVMGSFFLVRRELWKNLEGFDERFFVYYEEVDFSLRSRIAGYRTMFLSDAKVYHRGGGTSETIKAKRLFYSLRSKLYYAYKHFKTPDAWLAAGAILLIEPWTRMVWSLGRRQPVEMAQTLSAYWMLYCELPYLWKDMQRR